MQEFNGHRFHSAFQGKRAKRIRVVAAIGSRQIVAIVFMVRDGSGEVASGFDRVWRVSHSIGISTPSEGEPTWYIVGVRLGMVGARCR